MQKIISLYQRNCDTNRLVRDEVVPGAEWVLAGEGKATRKLDGTACMVKDGKLYKRHDHKKWKQGKPPPDNWIPAQAKPDQETGHWPGWVLVGAGPEDKWAREAWENQPKLDLGTYELIGPKIQGNPEGLDGHALVRHGSEVLPDAPRLFFAFIRDYLAVRNIEGIVWHHPDGRMVKIKKRDFGLPRKPQKEQETDDTSNRIP